MPSRPSHHRRNTSTTLVNSRSFRMPSAFTIFRAAVYGAVLLWTLICLAIAGHFQSILASSNLTTFVPLAIFVSCAGFLIIASLLLFSLKRVKNPISTRIELASLGLVGILWIALSSLLTTSDANDADVECYTSSTSTTLVDDPSFSTDVYHAQYRVLEAFSVFNAILIWGFFAILLALAIKHHFSGETQVWYCPVTSYPWFAKYSNKSKKALPKLPAPVTARTGGSRSKAKDPEYRKDYDDEEKENARVHRGYKDEREPRHARSHSRSRQAPPPPPPKYYDYERTRAPAAARTTDRYNRRERNPSQVRDKYARDASPRR